MGNKNKICKWCGKEYLFKPYRNGKFYCSKECQHLAYHEKQAKYCEECGSKFYTRIKKKFCSDKCRIKNLKSKKVKIKCSECGKNIFLDFSTFLLSKNNFCSNKCLKKWQKKTRKGELNPNWKGGKVSKKCDFCGNEFKVINARKLSARFCSSTCFGGWKIKNNFNFNGHKVGIRPDLKTFFRSRWESNFARYLNYLGVSWDYEPKTFFFNSEKKGTKNYTPDFYLKEFNLYVEVKGYLSPIGKSKLKKMSKYYPNVEIFLFTSKDYNRIEKEYGWKIDNWEWKNEEEAENILVYKKIKKDLPLRIMAIKELINKKKVLFKEIKKDKTPNYFLKIFKETITKAKKENKIPMVVFFERNSRTPILMCNLYDLNKINKK